VLLARDRPPKFQESVDSAVAAYDAAPFGSVVSLWEGEDLALYETLLDRLDHAKIRYYSQPLGVFPGVRRGSAFPIQPLARFGYHVAVLSSELAAAMDILEGLLEEEPEDVALAESAEPVARRASREKSREEPTLRLWTGEDEPFASFLEAALSENDIRPRIETDGKQREFYVCPSEEARAREIIREILEASPPE
jgi:hypothetical protein